MRTAQFPLFQHIHVLELWQMAIVTIRAISDPTAQKLLYGL